MEKWNAGILIFDDVEILDFAGPFEVFSRTRLVPGPESRRSDDSAPFHVFTVAKTAAPIRTTGGLRVIPHYGFADAPQTDLVVVPGGWGTRALLHAKAGLLQGRHATTHWGALGTLDALDAGVTVEREHRVVDDGVISSAGVASGIDMAFYVVESLFGREVADETAHYIEYRRDGKPAFRV